MGRGRMHKKAAESTARAEFSEIQNHVEKCRDEKEVRVMDPRAVIEQQLKMAGDTLDLNCSL